MRGGCKRAVPKDVGLGECIIVVRMGPVEKDLFALFAGAIATGLEHVQRRLGERGYIRKRSDWPELRWHENGLPWITEQYEGPIDYSDALKPSMHLWGKAATEPRFTQETS